MATESHLRRFANLAMKYMDTLDKPGVSDLSNVASDITNEMIQEITRRLKEAKDGKATTVHR